MIPYSTEPRRGNGHPVRIPESSISAALHARSREPFTDVLTALIGARPDPKALKFFADRYPHKWAQAIAIFAKLAGYHDKMEVEGTIALDIFGMSDAELMERLGEMNEQLAESSYPPLSRHQD